MVKTNHYIIGTRGSKLALIQAETVKSELSKLYPDFTFLIKPIKTTADSNPNVPLSEFPEPGVFTKELDVALLKSDIDMAVHSLKDIETDLPPKLKIGAFLKRTSFEDALVLRSDLKPKCFSLTSLPEGSVVGTSSVRRRSFLASKWPSLSVEDIRGNVDTRLAKLEKGNYSALILSSAGLERLSLGELITQKLDPKVFPPAVSQGVIAVVCREADTALQNMLRFLDDFGTRLTCKAERALLRKVGMGCKVPLGVYLRVDQWKEKQEMKVEYDILAANPSGKAAIKLSSDRVINRKCPRELLEKKMESFGEEVAEKLIGMGIKEIINSRKNV